MANETDPRYKTHSICSWAGTMEVGWEAKVMNLLDPATAITYRYTGRDGVANARSDIDFAISQLELRLAKAREADSILREIELWEAQDASHD